MKILDQNLKAKIVQESYKEGATVVSLAKKYGVSTSAIHRWRQSTSSEEKIEDKERAQEQKAAEREKQLIDKFTNLLKQQFSPFDGDSHNSVVYILIVLSFLSRFSF